MNDFDAIREVLIDQGRVLVRAGTEGCVVEANAIDQMQHLLTRESAHKWRALAGSCLWNVNSRHVAQRLRQDVRVVPRQLFLRHYHGRLRHVKNFQRLSASRSDSNRFKERSDVELKLQLQTPARRDVQHATLFAKTVLAHEDHVVGGDYFVEREVTVLIGERALCFKTRSAEQDHGSAADARAGLV